MLPTAQFYYLLVVPAVTGIIYFHVVDHGVGRYKRDVICIGNSLNGRHKTHTHTHTREKQKGKKKPDLANWWRKWNLTPFPFLPYPHPSLQSLSVWELGMYVKEEEKTREKVSGTRGEEALIMKTDTFPNWNHHTITIIIVYMRMKTPAVSFIS